MNKDLEHYIFHKENFLDKKYCEDCVEKLETTDQRFLQHWKEHTWYDGVTDHTNNDPDVISGDMFQKHAAEMNDFIIEKLHPVILEYIKYINFDWFEYWDGYSEIRFNRYRTGHTFYNHCDHIHSLFDGEKKGIPILSIIGGLNDNYEGGELIMFGDKKIKIRGGDLLIFPSNFLYPHEIALVTKGTRYTYVSWVW